MPRNYVRKTERCSWTEDAMKRAIRAIKEKSISIRGAASLFHIPYGTLQDRLRGRFEERKVNLGRRPVFSTNQEVEIASTILSLSKLFYGLTAHNIRQVIFKYAEELKISHPFNRDKEICGKDWVYSFMRRHPELAFRKPEATSVNRITAFNKEEIDIFFNNLELLFDKYKFESHSIYNVDETGITNVHNPGRIVAKKGAKQVGAITSGERGQTTTVICCFSASGQYIPPMFIFKRMRMKEGLDKNGPVGALYQCSKSGWVTEELFTEWLQHFAKFSKATPEQPVLLILDNHSTHSSLASYNFCKSSGIHLLSIPPHTSHRLQPLDVVFYKPLKTAYQQECDKYIRTKNYEKINQTDIAELFANAYNRAATIEKSVNGFRVTGIFPINRHVFSEEEFAPMFTNNDGAQNSDHHQNSHLQSVSPQLDLSGSLHPRQLQYRTPSPTPPSNSNKQQTNSPLRQIYLQQQISPAKAGPSRTARMRHRSLSLNSDSSDSDLSLEEVVEDDDTDDEDKTIRIKNRELNVSFKDLCPAPNLHRKISNRRKQHSAIMTSTPLKHELEKKEERKLKKTEYEKMNNVKRNIHVSTKVQPNKFKKRKIERENIENEDVCFVCGEFGDNEVWWRCRSCGVWSHSNCTDAEKASEYICENCTS